MKLSECLNTADIMTLRGIAKRYDFACSLHSKMSLIQEITFAFQSKEFLKSHLPEWEKGRESALLRLCLDPRRAFSAEEIEALLGSSTHHGEPVLEAVLEGWLFPTTRIGGRLMYCIPDELKIQMRKVVVERVLEKVQVSDEGPLTYHEEGPAMARDLDVFLEYVLHHDVKLTTDGAMYKRNLQQVLALLEVTEEPLSGGWRFGYGRRFHDYPDRFALLYDYAYHQHFIDEQADGTLSTTEESRKWYDMSEVERQRALVKFYVSSYRRPIPRLPLVVQLIANVAHRWVLAKSMATVVDGFVNEYYYDSKDQVFEVRILEMLVHLGVIRKGTDEEAREWFQITKLGQQLLTPDAIPGDSDEAKERQRILIVQPNFEIVLTADQPFIASEVARFAELLQTGVVRVYRITEESAAKGIAGTKSVTEWLEFVQSHAQTPVPGNVERTLLEWERVQTGTEGTLTS